MTKPTDEVEWATDATFTSDGDAWGGDANKINPGIARRAEGAEPDTFPAEYFNHLLNAHGNVIQYFLDSVTSDDEHVYPDGAKTRTVVLSAMQAVGRSASGVGTDAGWYAALFGAAPNFSGGYVYSRVAQAVLTLGLNWFLPDGAEVTRVRALVDPGAARPTVTDRMALVVDEAIIDFSGAAGSAVGAATATGGDSDDGTAAIQYLDTGTISVTINKTSPANDVRVHVVSGNTVANDLVYAFEITYEDTGLRNL